eukprot:COSAG04_NODE_3173_length_3091_cov_1.212901_1_plen_56_part_10
MEKACVPTYLHRVRLPPLAELAGLAELARSSHRSDMAHTSRLLERSGPNDHQMEAK